MEDWAGTEAEEASTSCRRLGGWSDMSVRERRAAEVGGEEEAELPGDDAGDAVDCIGRGGEERGGGGRRLRRGATEALTAAARGSAAGSESGQEASVRCWATRLTRETDAAG